VGAAESGPADDSGGATATRKEGKIDIIEIKRVLE
jgi:hypothetical protein